MFEAAAFLGQAAELDPNDRYGVEQFRRIARHLLINLDQCHQATLLERLEGGLGMLDLASICGEANEDFRHELIVAAEALVVAANGRPAAAIVQS